MGTSTSTSTSTRTSTAGRARRRARAALALSAAALLGLAACQDPGEPAASGTASAEETAATDTAPSDGGLGDDGDSSRDPDRTGEDVDPSGDTDPADGSLSAGALPQLALAPRLDDDTQGSLVAGFEWVRVEDVTCDLLVAPGSTDTARCTIEGAETEYVVHPVRGTDADATPSLLVTVGPLPEGIATTVADPDTTIGYGPTMLFFDDPAHLEADGLETRAQVEVDGIGASAEVGRCTTERDEADAARVECSAVGGVDSPHGEGTALAITLYPTISASGDPVVVGLVRPRPA